MKRLGMPLKETTSWTVFIGVIPILILRTSKFRSFWLRFPTKELVNPKQSSLFLQGHSGTPLTLEAFHFQLRRQVFFSRQPPVELAVGGSWAKLLGTEKRFRATVAFSHLRSFPSKAEEKHLLQRGG